VDAIICTTFFFWFWKPSSTVLNTMSAEVEDILRKRLTEEQSSRRQLEKKIEQLV